MSTETVQTLNDTSATIPATEPSIYFPTQEPVDGEREVMEALLFGNLTVVDKCIWVITEDGEPINIYLIIWPPNFTLNSGTDPAQIIDDNGNVVASIGDDVRLSGGEHRRLLDPSVSETLPPSCLGGPYWIVGEEISTIEP
jgi:hypothetical protein